MMEVANWDITMNTSGRNGRLFCCLQLYIEIRWHVSRVSTLKDFFLFKEIFAIARKRKGNTK